jgi:hypothetical protein
MIGGLSGVGFFAIIQFSSKVSLPCPQITTFHEIMMPSNFGDISYTEFFLHKLIAFLYLNYFL